MRRRFLDLAFTPAVQAEQARQGARQYSDPGAYGDDDQLVPIGASAMLSSKPIKNATLRICKGAPHGMCTTLKDRVNAELLAFFKQQVAAVGIGVAPPPRP